jgi:predicted acylesterase/phospholipase RssA
VRATVLLAALLVCVSCARPHTEAPSATVSPPPPTPTPIPAIGLVLTGGGSFGAWEVGALEALTYVWKSEHREEPPIRVVAGTSTGALLAPFALLGGDALKSAANEYTSVKQAHIVAVKPEIFVVPFYKFVVSHPSPADAGYPKSPEGKGRLLYARLRAQLATDNRIGAVLQSWGQPVSRRLVVTTTDFRRGRPDIISSSPENAERLVDAIFASAMAPLAFPPVDLPGPTGGTTEKTTHLDGGVFSVAPFGALFATAAIDPPIALTHIFLVSAYPSFPGNDESPPPVQKAPFPRRPNFLDIGDRLDSVLAEAGVTKDLRLARAAIELRKRGLSPAEVRALADLEIRGEPPRLIEVFPSGRMGWRDHVFRVKEMAEMRHRGFEQGCQQIAKALGISVDCNVHH